MILSDLLKDIENYISYLNYAINPIIDNCLDKDNIIEEQHEYNESISDIISLIDDEY
jgi:hypothetical protein